MQAVEAAVAHEQGHVARSQFVCQGGEEGIHLRKRLGGHAALPDGADDRVGIEHCIRVVVVADGWSLQEDRVGGVERLAVGRFEELAAAGVGARFEDGHEAPIRVRRADGLQRGLDGGGVVGKVVEDEDAIRFAPYLLPSFHARK